ncbi:hypothetical protein PR048_028292 [Dryococelus australis]|uniref:CHK kinase-like domain-containing protein n=1 Tax=Dryococelus australis TaxID=614101 RepID=A0ABQ9GIT2_9NEOP|nr:hypothetical protein PR048_028292 [Dryococelus australis]
MASGWKGKLQKADLERLLGQEIVSYEATNLTAAGDNYGSVMVAVDVTLQSGKVLNIVAKMFPESEVVQQHFQSHLSMRKEVDVYLLVSSEFEKIQEEQSVPLSERLHIFCHCPGARLTLQGYDDRPLADEDSILLLENLKVQGYRVADRVLGQDLIHAELVMTDLAKFHATGLAIKLRKPDVFRSKIMKACDAIKIRWLTKDKDEIRTRTYLESLREIPICEQNINILRDRMKQYVDYSHSDEFRTPTESFATMVHYDLWTNNLMFRYKSETDEKPVHFKMVDFQVVRYGSAATDVIFYLFTSTQTGMVTHNLDHLLKLYHDTFVHWLNILGCDSNVFKYSDFLDEVNSVAPTELVHILFWLLPITLHKDQMKEYSMYSPPDQKRTLNQDFIRRTSEIVTVFSQRDWL